MRMFHKKDGGVVQLVDKEDMKLWPIELPLIFIEYIRNNKLDTYEDSKVKKEIEKYLDEILEDIAIPRMIEVLEGDDENEIESTLIRIEELAKKKIKLVEPLKPYVENFKSNKNSNVKKLSSSIMGVFIKEERRKDLAKKRKSMREKEKAFLEGKISPEEYAKARKDYLLVKEG